MYTNKKAIVIISAILYLSTPLSIFANEKSNNSIQNSKLSVITFQEITRDDLYDFSKYYEEELDVPKGVVFENSKVSLKTDIALLAKESGIPIKAIEEKMLFEKAFGEYAKKLLTRYPDQITAIWMEEKYNTSGHILFVGDVPREIEIEVKRQGLNDKIFLESGGNISISDNYKRAVLVSKALIDLKYKNTVTFFDHTKNIIKIEIKLLKGEKKPIKKDLISAIQTQFDKSSLKGKSAIINLNNINLKLIEGDEPIVSTQSSLGGSWILGGGGACTSGWAVSGPSGDGIITAGHCPAGINQIIDNEEGGLNNLQWISEVHGTEGDVEYHTTDDTEDSRFYADATRIRSVNHTMFTVLMTIPWFNKVCVYGRSSNIRTCDHQIQAINVTTTSTLNGITTTVGNLVRASNVSTIGGDSGGGWSWANIAYGIHHGTGEDEAGNEVSYFMPILEAQNALGVSVMVAD